MDWSQVCCSAGSRKGQVQSRPVTVGWAARKALMTGTALVAGRERAERAEGHGAVEREACGRRAWQLKRQAWLGSMSRSGMSASIECCWVRARGKLPKQQFQEIQDR